MNAPCSTKIIIELFEDFTFLNLSKFNDFVQITLLGVLERAFSNAVYMHCVVGGRCLTGWLEINK